MEPLGQGHAARSGVPNQDQGAEGSACKEHNGQHEPSTPIRPRMKRILERLQQVRHRREAIHRPWRQTPREDDVQGWQSRIARWGPTHPWGRVRRTKSVQSLVRRDAERILVGAGVRG